MAMRNLLLITGCLALLGGCSRLENVGKAPDFSPMAAEKHDNQITRSISIPMPDEQPTTRKFSSLWRSGNKEFFRDPRAKQVGDIVTILINIDDAASIKNQTQRSRNNSEDASINGLFGVDTWLEKKFSNLDLDNAAKLQSQSGSQGQGQIIRNEEINLRLAAVVTHVLPNGSLAVAGRQEVLVNYEMRDLRLAGVIRPEDINAKNEISYDKIAEARIAYGGRGQITDVQQPRYGQQIFDIIMPW